MIDNTLRYALLAACMAHVEGYYSIKSLAFQRCNPGNIEVHEGKRYDTPVAGFAALVSDIAANKGKTLSQFIEKYAPPSENDSVFYLHEVSTLSGIGPDEVL
jgi:hypothetical protein